MENAIHRLCRAIEIFVILSYGITWTEKMRHQHTLFLIFNIIRIKFVLFLISMWSKCVPFHRCTLVLKQLKLNILCNHKQNQLVWHLWNEDTVGIEMSKGLATWNESFFDFDSFNKEPDWTISLYFLITLDDRRKSLQILSAHLLFLLMNRERRNFFFNLMYQPYSP